MKKADLKTLVFERFEQRRLEILKKRNSFQAELDQDIHQLQEAYGPAAIEGLAKLELTHKAAPAIVSPKATDDAAPTAPPQTPKRRRRRGTNWGAIQTLLDQRIPAIVATLGADGQEFTVRQVFDHLQAGGGTDKAPADSKHVSLYMGTHAKKLGLKVEKRPSADHFNRAVNFFKIGGKGRSAKSPKAKKKERVDWQGAIEALVRKAPKGLTKDQLKSKLLSGGIAAQKFSGPAFRDALANLQKKGAIVVNGDRYQAS